jgi:acetolactate synthase I/II/III large subunit
MDMFNRQLDTRVATGCPLLADASAPDLPEATAARIADALIGAQRPLLYIGGGLRGDGRTALLSLAEHLDIPIAHSLMGKGVLPDSHPLVAGMTGFWGLELTNRYTREADIVLALGTRFAETDSSSWEPSHTWDLPPGKLIQIDIDPTEIGRNYPVAIGAVADAALAAHAIDTAVRTKLPEGRSRPGVRAEIHQARTTLFTDARQRGHDEAFPLAPERILADLRDNVPADTILVTDVGWNKNGVAQCYELPAEGRFITPGGSSTMGFGPAAAIGAQIAQPDRVVVALIGDGGMSAQLPALPMVVERGLPVVFVVMNNRAHGTIADLQSVNFGAEYGCEFKDREGNAYSPDFAGIAESCGADGYRITAPDDLAKALRAAVANRRPALLDVPMVNTPVPTPGHWNINDIYQGHLS